MKLMKKVFITLTLLLAVGLVFRGWLYRTFIAYKEVGIRAEIPAQDENLIAYIEAGAGEEIDPDVKEIVRLALSETSEHLSFTFEKSDIDPNSLVVSRSAHCVGYALFFTAACNLLLKKYQLSDHWAAKPRIGQLYLFDTNIHKYFNSPFFKDHDFVIIENKSTGERLAVDPTVDDYLGIKFVTYKE